MTPMQWLYGDHTMMEMIEKKRTLCKEIKSRQKVEKGLCKQESMPILPSWKKSNGSKKYSPPPYSKQQTVFWDTAIWHRHSLKMPSHVNKVWIAQVAMFKQKSSCIPSVGDIKVLDANVHHSQIKEDWSTYFMTQIFIKIFLKDVYNNI